MQFAICNYHFAISRSCCAAELDFLQITHATELTVTPPRVELPNSRARQQLLVTASGPAGYLLDATRKLHRIIDRKDSFSPETIYFARGSLYITDSRNGKLYMYTPGEELKTIAAFGGQLKNVQGVTVDDAGNIFVSVQADLKHKVGDVIEVFVMERVAVTAGAAAKL